MGVLRNPPRTGALPVALLVAVAFGGCIAPDMPAETLSASAGNGQLVIVAELVDGELTAAEAYWEADRPAPVLELDSFVVDWEARVLKNNVLLDRAPLVGTPENAFVVWRSGPSDTVVAAGDTFELFLVDLANGEALASYKVTIDQ